MLPHGVSLAIRIVSREIAQLRNQNIIIALDGYSSSGKSTLAKDLSKLLDITHIDSGAMYRAITLHLISNRIDIQDHKSVIDSLADIKIDFRIIEGLSATHLNGKNVEKEIRQMAISEWVSEVATISRVRSFLVSEQRRLANKEGVIMDGRDIGTVVFPDADVKLFITASTEVRAKRRFEELVNKGIEISLSEVRSNLDKRDHIDSTRQDSPLKKAEDAFGLDTTQLDRGQMLTEAVVIIHQKIKGKRQ